MCNSFQLIQKSLVERPYDKTNKMACAPSEDTDQPRSLATNWVHSHFVGFVMRRLISLKWMQLQPKHDKTFKITSSLCIFCSLIRVLAWPSVNSQECKQTLVRLCGCTGWSGSLLSACDFVDFVVLWLNCWNVLAIILIFKIHVAVSKERSILPKHYPVTSVSKRLFSF